MRRMSFPAVKPRQISSNDGPQIIQNQVMDTEDIMAAYTDDVTEMEQNVPPTSDNSENDLIPTANEGHIGFSTAKGNQIPIAAKEALRKSEEIFEDKGRKESATHNLGNSGNGPTSMPQKDWSIGFSTAGGNTVLISREALEKVKGMFKEDDDCHFLEQEHHESGSEDMKLKAFDGNVGFSTAKGTKISSLSKEALSRATAIFNEISQDPTSLQPTNDKTNAVGIVDATIKRTGFTTANGSKIPSLSNEAILKAKALFDTIDEPVPEPTKENTIDVSNSVRATSSAKGPKIHGQSKETLSKTNNLEMSTDSTEVECPIKVIGFTTAKGTKLPGLSKDALQKAKALFDETDEVSGAQPLKRPADKASGFSDATFTSSETTISKKSLEKAQALFSEGRTLPLRSLAFSTAKGSSVTISEEAFARVKSIFKEDDLALANGHPFEKPKPMDNILEKLSLGGSSKKRKSEEDLKNQESKKVCTNDTDEAFQDDFEIDTQFLASVERAAFKSPNEMSIKGTKCKLVGIPKVEPFIIRSREEERQRLRGIIMAKKTQINLPKVEGSRTQAKRLNKKSAKKLSDFKINTEEKVAKHKSVHWSTLSMTSELAADYVFIGRQYFSEDKLVSSLKIELGDGAQVVLNDACNIDLDALTLAFLSSPGVNPSKVNDAWVKNHYRWIVWKLASMERRFPDQFASSLNPHEVLLQLKYRYDLEVDGESRSALKKVYEKDDLPTKCLVLCVANICSRDQIIFLELTDGWYSIGCIFNDQAAEKLVKNHQIQIGTKLVTFGAELCNLADPCSPLEAPWPSDPEVVEKALNKEKSCALLKLSLNSTRRARWDTKLGYYPCTAMPTSFDKLIANAGLASQLTLYVARKHPLVYSNETTKEVISQKMADSLMSTAKHEQDLERIYHEVQREFEHREWAKQKSRKPLTRRSVNLISTKEISKLTYGKDISEAIENSPDPTRIEAVLTPSQVEALQEYKRNQWEELHLAMKAEVEARVRATQKLGGSKDKLVALMKLSVVDVVSQKPGILSIWRPNDDLAQGIKENSFVKVHNVNVGNIRDFVNLKSTKLSRFERINAPSDFDLTDFKRSVESIETILEEGFSPILREVDVFGAVVNIDQLSRGFQPVHICDSMFNFVSIQFWGGIAKFCMESVIKPGAVLLFSNLQWRNSSSQGNFFQSENAKSLPTIPCLYVNECTVVSVDSKDATRSQLIKDLTAEVSNSESDFMIQAKERLNQLTLSKPKMLTPSVMTPPPSVTASRLNRISSVESVWPKSPAVEIVENSPAYYQSMRNKQRLAVLEQYGEPPTPIDTTPLQTRKSIIRAPFKVPFIDRLKKANE